ncbi:hypothetical protein COOONC_14686 [Cooperia oncophora]
MYNGSNFRTVPGTTTVYTSDSNRNFSTQDVFNKKEEMNETLPLGSISNTHANTQGGYRDQQGHDVSYKRETQTAVDPGKEYALLKEMKKRVVATRLEPRVISTACNHEILQEENRHRHHNDNDSAVNGVLLENNLNGIATLKN